MKACEDQEVKIKKFIKGNLDRKEALLLKSHVLTCEVCRKLIQQEDPLLLFSLLSLQKKDERFWHGYWEPIREKIALQKGWFGRLGFMRPLPAAAILSSLLLVTALLLYMIMNQTFYGPAPTVEVLPLKDGVMEKDVLIYPLPVVEGEFTTTANIVTLSIGNTDVVMIFDENMDI